MKCPNENCVNGKIEKFDLMNAKKTFETCPVCHGAGELPDKREGLYVERIPGMPFWIEWFEDDRLISWAKIRLIPAMSTQSKHLVIEVDHIETKKKYRRQGHAKNVIAQLKGMFQEQGGVKYILTGWNDSSVESRALFESCGFVRDGKALVWTRN